MPAELPVLVPHESVNDESVRLLRWLVEDGQPVVADQPLAEVEGSKATFPIVAPAAGRVQFLARVGDEVAVGTPLCVVVAESGGGISGAAPSTNGTLAPVRLPPDPAVLPVSPPPPGRPEFAAPAVPVPPAATTVAATTVTGQRVSRRAQELIQQHGLDPDRFRDLPLVRAEDVRAAAAGPAAPPPSPPVVAGPVSRVPGAPPFEPVPLSRQKLTEIRHLRKGAEATVPSQVSVLVPAPGLRAALLTDPAAVSLTALVIFEAARLLRRYPALNAFYAERAACQYRHVNVGFAVAGDHGLKVPVVRAADTKPLGQVSEEVRGLLAAYAGDRLDPGQLAGGTFTVSDLSGAGVFALSPLIVEGQSAILGVGAETPPAGGAGGGFVLTLTFDHQVSDGLKAGRFMAELTERLTHHHSTLRRAAPPPGCSRCGRTVHELRPLGGHLIQTVTESGGTAAVCTSCLAGF